MVGPDMPIERLIELSEGAAPATPLEEELAPALRDAAAVLDALPQERCMSAIDVLARARARRRARRADPRARARYRPTPQRAFAYRGDQARLRGARPGDRLRPIDAAPGVVTRWHPLGRDSSDLRAVRRGPRRLPDRRARGREPAEHLAADDRDR